METRRKGFIKINGCKVPYPDEGLDFIISTAVEGGRNKNNKVVATRVGRDNYKIDSLQWNWLTAEEWSYILNLVKDFYITVTFPDMVTNSMKTLKMYVGDRQAKPYFPDDNTELPSHYTECKFNIIDVGEV